MRGDLMNKGIAKKASKKAVFPIVVVFICKKLSTYNILT